MASPVLQTLLAYTEGNKLISWDPGHPGPYLTLYLYKWVANGDLSFQTGFLCILKFPLLSRQVHQVVIEEDAL
jgi:hypothetical protein